MTKVVPMALGIILKQLVEEYLAEMEWDELVEIDQGSLATKTDMKVSYNGQIYRLFIETDPGKSWIEVYLYSDHKVPAGRMSVACLLANRINRRTYNGYIAAVGAEDGFQFKQVMDIAGCNITTLAIHNMVDSGFELMEHWGSKMDLVCNSIIELDPMDGCISPAVS